MGPRKYYLDWLRVLAFLCLIVFHVGCLYASWDYNIKSPRLEPRIDWALLALTPWRMALLFFISGVASRYLISKLGAGRFALDRARRLVPVILVGIWVVIPPQTYIMLLDKGLLHVGYFDFWVHSYLAADQTLVAPLHRTMPTYDHLWFIVYLLVYTSIFAAVTALLRVLVQLFPAVHVVRARLPLLFLLAVPVLWLMATNFLIERRLPVTFNVLNDWGSHLKWAGLFVIGILCASREDFWAFLSQRRGILLVFSVLFLAAQFACRAMWLQGRLDQMSGALAWSAVTSLYACTMMGALCGYAHVHLNRRSALLSHLNQAILPIYVLHQPILLISAHFVFPFELPLTVEAAVLFGITGLGALAIYEAAIRPFRVMRVLFGLKHSEVDARSESGIIQRG
jgi:glucans biosynthesis protein C